MNDTIHTVQTGSGQASVGLRRGIIGLTVSALLVTYVALPLAVAHK